MATMTTDPETASDAPLAAEFEPPAREAWLALVAKVLKGGDFDRRLVARTADGIAIAPLYTRADRIAAAAPIGRSAYFPGGWDVRQRHAEPEAQAANAAILEDLSGGATSVLLQVLAPGQIGLGYGAEALGAALEGVYLDACAVALDAGENTMDAAGSLIEIWRAAKIGENQRRGAFNYDPLGVLART
jgi:methylmalonyl-CoA mutase